MRASCVVYTNTFECDANGQPTKVILPGGETTTTEYDALGRKVKQVDAAGNATSYA